jgi:hypothetical protein
MQAGYDLAAGLNKQEWQNRMNQGTKSGNKKPEREGGGHLHMLPIGFIDRRWVICK